MNTIKQTVAELAPHLYDYRREVMGRPQGIDMSRSNQCQPLSFDMMEALHNRDVDVCREYHMTQSGMWHYTLAHTPIDSEPSDEDIITDLNPWQGLGYSGVSGYLHGPRHEVMGQMLNAGVPDYLVSLRGLETLVLKHSGKY